MATFLSCILLEPLNPPPYVNPYYVLGEELLRFFRNSPNVPSSKAMHFNRQFSDV